MNSQAVKEAVSHSAWVKAEATTICNGEWFSRTRLNEGLDLEAVDNISGCLEYIESMDE